MRGKMARQRAKVTYLPVIHPIEVKPLDDYRLWLQFEDGSKRVFDCKPYLNGRIFQALKDKTLFDSVYVGNGGTATWQDGNLDFAPETLYYQGIPVDV